MNRRPIRRIQENSAAAVGEVKGMDETCPAGVQQALGPRIVCHAVIIAWQTEGAVGRLVLQRRGLKEKGRPGVVVGGQIVPRKNAHTAAAGAKKPLPVVAAEQLVNDFLAALGWDTRSSLLLL